MLGVIAMDWCNLLFASYAYEPRVIAERLPKGLLVDVHDHKAWVTLVAFENKAVRLRGAPAFLGVDVPELNLRTYVTRGGESGVYFFSLDAAGPMSVLGARIAFQLPYHLAKIKLHEEAGGFRFASERRYPGAAKAVFQATYTPKGKARRAATGSLDRFLLERYRLYTKGPLGGLLRVDVEHEPWNVQDVEAEIATNTLLQAHGLPTPAAAPVLHFAAARHVVVSPPVMV